MNARACRIGLAATALLISPAIQRSPARAMWAQPQPQPTNRLVQNLSAYLKTHPNDADALYALGRVHYAAFASVSTPDTVRALGFQPGQAAGTAVIPHGESVHIRPSVKPGDKDTAIRTEHLRLALENLTAAIRKRPNRPESHLTLASALEQGLYYAPLIEKNGKSSSPKALQRAWWNRAAREYLQAFDLSYKEAIKQRPMSAPEPEVCMEAGQGFLRCTEAGKADSIARTDILRARAGLALLEKRPRSNMVTPIVFSLQKNACLSDLLAAGDTSSFDLDGSGVPERHSWVAPTTGILVWDPEGTGRIDSGRQLFGSVTWWVFWPDGYRALDALDDNRNGRLSDQELKGIGVWFDRNSDGIADSGEVMPVSALHIQSIGCRPSGRDNDILVSRAGIRLDDGSEYATWDWVAEPR